jgi:iron complex transport system permease protein
VKSRRPALALAVLLPVAVVLACAAGSVRLPFEDVLRSMLAALGLGTDPLDTSSATILWSLRLPRVLIAGLVGGALAVVGATLQAVFRNPMADSGLLGVGSGAALGAVVAVRFGWSSEQAFALPAAAFAGAMVAVLAVQAVSTTLARGSLHGLLLTGIAVAAMAGAGTSVLLVATEEFRVRAVLFWLAGGLEGRGWMHLRTAAALILPATVALVLASRALDLLALGEEEAASLGLRVSGTRFALLAGAALAAGAATAVAGLVPFVGLVVPHALRPRVGARAGALLPASFLGGALLVIVADAAARTVAHVDLPLGSLTALVGAPYFLYALRGSGARA